MSVIPAIATQLHMAFGSTALFDNHFNIAHFLKIISYAVPLAGLILDYMGSYREVDRTNTELTTEIEIRKKAQLRISTQNSVTRALTEAKTLDEAALKIIQIICKNFGWDTGAAWKRDVNDNLLHCAELWHIPERDLGEFITVTRQTTFSPGRGLPGRVLSSGKPAWVNDVVEDSNFQRATVAGKAGLHGAIAFPIILKNDVLLVFDFFSSNRKEPDEYLLGLVGVIGHQLSLFIERMQAQQMVEARARISALNGEIGVALTHGRELGEILKSCTEAIVRNVDAAFARIWTLNEAENMLELQASAGLYTHLDGAHSRVPIGKLKIGLIAEERKSHITNSVIGDPHVSDQEWAKQEGMVSFAGYPLIVAGQLVGVMAMFARYPLADFALDGLLVVADSVAISIKGKQEERELIRARDMAIEAARLKSEFLANMSHEIRTTMNAVIGVTEMLLDSDLSNEQRDSVETIHSAGDALLEIINDILDFSKIEAGKLVIATEDFDLRRLIEDTIDVLAGRAHSKNIELAFVIHHDVYTAFRGDPGRIRQILTNLGGNAIKFTGKGEVLIRITTESETDESATIRFSISDTGMGITPEGQRRLFQSFSQVDGTSTRKFGGTGLGLAISKKLVEAMGGEIGVESTFGKGSTFWFVLPLSKRISQPDNNLKRRKDIKSLRILIVDDNSTNRKILQYQLEFFGMGEEVETGAEALSLIARRATQGEPYDLVVIDMQMPEMDGITLAKSIKTDSRIASTPLLLLSSSTNNADAASARAAGFAACLSKPTKERQLIETIEKIFSSADKVSDETSPQAPIPRKQVQPHKSIDPNIRLLVADDDPVNRKVASIQLKKLGFKADFAENGLEVLEALERNSYNLILMDCQMPKMDGYTAAAEIRRREGNSKHTLIIAVTAHALQGEREKCLAAGMDDYLSKPVKSDALRKMLERWLSDSSGEKTD